MVGMGMGLSGVHLVWLGWGWACRGYISCGWDGDGPVGGTSHGLGMGMGLSKVHLMWLGWSPLLQVLTRTLSSTNSTSYQRLMAELFRQSVPIAKGFAYFYDLQEVSGATNYPSLLHPGVVAQG